jgi:hypothetical protein
LRKSRSFRKSPPHWVFDPLFARILGFALCITNP